MSVLERAKSPKSSKEKSVAAPARAASAFVATPPRVDLLPPEVLKRKRGAALRSRVLVALVVVIAIVLAALGLAFIYSANSNAALAESQSRSTELNAKIGGYADVKKLESELAALRAAQKVGGSTDVDWAGFLDELSASLPNGMSITALSVQSTDVQGTGAAAAAGDTAPPLATLTLSADARDVPSISTWLDNLTTLPGYRDATIGSVSGDGASAYTASVTLHIDDGALSHKYVPATKGSK